MPDDDGLPDGMPKPTVEQALAMRHSASAILEEAVDSLNMVTIVCVNRCDHAQSIKMRRPFLGDCAAHGCLREHVQRDRWINRGFSLPPVPRPGAPPPPSPSDDA